MDLALTGRSALVLGGAKGIGRGIADALAAEGARLTIASRDAASLAAAAGEITAATGAAVEHLTVDLADNDSVDALVAAIGDVDVLVLNGGGPPPGPISAVPPDVWQAQFERMVLAPIRITQAVLPGMRERGFGRILTVLSSGVIQPIPALGLSNALRLALVGWMKTLAGEVAAEGVTVNGLAPGRIQTQRIDALDTATAERQNKPIETVKAESRATIPAGRNGTIEEFGALAAFLASPRASYITGSVMRVDGGAIRSI